MNIKKIYKIKLTDKHKRKIKIQKLYNKTMNEDRQALENLAKQ